MCAKHLYNSRETRVSVAPDGSLDPLKMWCSAKYSGVALAIDNRDTYFLPIDTTRIQTWMRFKFYIWLLSTVFRCQLLNWSSIAEFHIPLFLRVKNIVDGCTNAGCFSKKRERFIWGRWRNITRLHYTWIVFRWADSISILWSNEKQIHTKLFLLRFYFLFSSS